MVVPVCILWSDSSLLSMQLSPLFWGKRAQSCKHALVVGLHLRLDSKSEDSGIASELPDDMSAGVAIVPRRK